MHRPCLKWSSITPNGVAVCWCGLLFLAGCNSGPPVGKLVPVEGKVTLDDKPLTGGGIIFHAVVEKGTDAPVLRPVGAQLQDDGSYKVRLPVGKYRIQLDRGDKGDKKVWSLVGQKYRRADSTLVIEVAEDKPEGSYDLKLRSSAKQRR